MRWLKIWALVAGTSLTGSAVQAEVRLSMHDGRVSLVAHDATVRQILTEWARVGQTRIVNAERVPGGPVSIELTDVPEEQALDVLLRSASGYVAAPRPTMAANVSRYDRILVLPTSMAPTVAAPSRSSAPSAAPTFAQPAMPLVAPAQQPPAADDDDTGGQPTAAAGPQQPARGPVFSPFPQPQATVAPQVMPQQGPLVLPQPTAPAATSVAYPGAPTGTPQSVATPGMAVPVPQQPAQGPPPSQPRRPGGPQ